MVIVWEWVSLKAETETKTWVYAVDLRRNPWSVGVRERGDWDRQGSRGKRLCVESMRTHSHNDLWKCYLPLLLIYLHKRKPRAFVHWHSSYSVRIFFSHLNFKKCHMLILCLVQMWGYDCKNSLGLDFPLFSLQNFMYKMEDFIQQTSAIIIKRITVRMGGRALSKGLAEVRTWVRQEGIE